MHDPYNRDRGHNHYKIELFLSDYGSDDIHSEHH